MTPNEKHYSKAFGRNENWGWVPGQKLDDGSTVVGVAPCILYTRNRNNEIIEVPALAGQAATCFPDLSDLFTAQSILAILHTRFFDETAFEGYITFKFFDEPDENDNWAGLTIVFTEPKNEEKHPHPPLKFGGKSLIAAQYDALAYSSKVAEQVKLWLQK